MYNIIEKKEYISNDQHIKYLESLQKCLENSLNNVFKVSKKGSLKKSINANLICGGINDKEALKRILFNISLYKK